MKPALLLCAIPFAATAQTSATDVDNYSRLNLNLVLSQPVHSGYGITAVSNHNLYGLGIGYLYGIHLTDRQLPLFLEVGPECNFTRRTEEVDYWDDLTLTLHDEVSTQMLSLSTPINLAYHCRLTENVVLAPSAGLNAKVNLLADMRSQGVTYNYFDHDAHRFQWGWNAGCGLYFDRLYLGLRYAADFTPFMKQGPKKDSYQNFDLNLGLRF